jgi:hypothetical protein
MSTLFTRKVDSTLFTRKVDNQLFVCQIYIDDIIFGTSDETFCEEFSRVMTNMSAFRTREDRQPTSKFVVACPCPDGLMQDGTQEGNEAYVILHRGARSRGYKRCGRAGARERERKRGFGLEASCLSLPLPHLSYSAYLYSSASCVRVFVCSYVCFFPSPLEGPGHPLL